MIEGSCGGTHTMVVTDEGRCFIWGRGAFGRWAAAQADEPVSRAAAPVRDGQQAGHQGPPGPAAPLLLQGSRAALPGHPGLPPWPHAGWARARRRTASPLWSSSFRAGQSAGA